MNGMIEAAIIGAPRSGTSTLFNQLDSHPEVQGSNPKETYFFMDAGHPLTDRQKRRGLPTFHTADLSAFGRFFEGPGNKIRLEATTHHYYQNTARDVFSHFDPMTHIFFILRQPAHRIRSSFLFTKHNRGYIDSGLTFNRYVDILLNGSLSSLDKYYHSNSSLYIAKRELKLSKYILWLRRWEESLDREHIHPIIFERFAGNTRRTLGRVCRVLNISPSDAEHSSSSKNETTLVRSPSLQKLAREIGTFIPDGWLKSEAKSLYERLQIRERSSTSASDTDYGVECLEDYFKPWNERLAQHSGLRLSQWDCS